VGIETKNEMASQNTEIQNAERRTQNAELEGDKKQTEAKKSRI
jgi:hypothetical protein